MILNVSRFLFIAVVTTTAGVAATVTKLSLLSIYLDCQLKAFSSLFLLQCSCVFLFWFYFFSLLFCHLLVTHLFLLSVVVAFFFCWHFCRNNTVILALLALWLCLSLSTMFAKVWCCFKFRVCEWHSRSRCFSNPWTCLCLSFSVCVCPINT